METTLTLRDPIAFAKAEAEREIGRALDVAHEIYLVRQCATIHYADLMDDVPAGTASKDMLLAWIRDYPNRPGVITLYMRSRPNHFDGGAWMARYFAQFIEFAKDKLTDRLFVGSRKKADLFAASFADEDWRRKACAVLGLRMLEEMYKRRKLRSREAEHVLFMNFQNREMLEAIGRIVGRVAKNNGLAPFDANEAAQVINENFKAQWRHWRANPGHEAEMRMFERFELDIERTMSLLFQPHALLESAVMHG
ncbi:MAG: hypothetical protein K6T81_12430 [Alicyclobacillus macrosporangiidus]|uniref:hypothetical protein n=1 Tax=Alicyclobacillus macrosporangiidus TaxID=392015 RepID=UPI0026F303EC|nr:hypothetical protein [Alicyclobacillus macrosporangiidus]MCL6599530.1 hypothetical protein [Alicyclobacillus macrosporangiidus]